MSVWVQNATKYCNRWGNPDIAAQLKGGDPLTTQAAKHFLSVRELQEHSLLREYRALHQKPSIDLKTLS